MIRIHCPECHSVYSRSRFSNSIVKKDGFYYRSSDRKSVQRYFCNRCLKRFSSATFGDCYWQKKRQLNSSVVRLLVSLVSIRECARVLGINRKTVSRKMVFMGIKAQKELLKINLKFPKAKQVIYDDLITFEHSKRKPLSLGLMVEDRTRRISGYTVARMPAQGLLAASSVAQYGKRVDERPQKRAELMKSVQALIAENAVVKSDEKKPGAPQKSLNFWICIWLWYVYFTI